MPGMRNARCRWSSLPNLSLHKAAAFSMLPSSRTSRCVTVRRSSALASDGRSASSFLRTSSGLERAVAIIGAVVVFRRCLVNANPIPREDGEVSIHGRRREAVGCILY